MSNRYTSRFFAGSLFLLLFLFFLTQQCLSREYTLAEIERVENQAISNRERLKSWHVRIFHTEIKNDPSYDPDHGDERGQFIGMELYKSENADFFREDRSYHLDGTSSKRVRVLGKEWLYRFGQDVVRREGTSEDIPLLRMTNRGKNVDFPQAYDIRTLGFVLSSIRSIPFELRRHIGSPKRKDISMMDEVLNGEQCFKISFTDLSAREKNNTIFIWISPSRDYNPLRFEINFPDRKQVSIFDITVDKQQGYWFPSLIHTTVMREGNLFLEHKTQIEVVSFNKKLDPNLFNEKGLNLPVGTLVLMDPEPFPDTFTWDGEKIVGLSGATLEPVVSTRGNTTRYLLIAMGLALICTSCLMKYFEMLKRQREKSGD